MTIQYFKFEEDFVEDNVRCIPMIVRFKLGACGIKMKLAEWCKMTVEERISLAERPCQKNDEVVLYREYVTQLIFNITHLQATDLTIEKDPPWAQLTEVPSLIMEKVNEINASISLGQWRGLNTLQRFALLKLSSVSHENKNFPKALREFNLA